MSRYATREDDVGRLLRGRVFVDLHRVVRQGLRASVESYSIKQLEPFYGFVREVDLATATRALIQVEARLESADAAGVPDPLRTEIEGYNRDDCLSTLRLAAWLETAALFEALTAGLPVDGAGLDDGQRARRLLAHLLEFHRREDKSMWWEFFHRCGFTEEEHVESRATLGALTYDGEAGQVKRSVIHRYRFPEQSHEIKVGDSPKNPDTAESDELQAGILRHRGRTGRERRHDRAEARPQLARAAPGGEPRPARRPPPARPAHPGGPRGRDDGRLEVRAGDGRAGSGPAEGIHLAAGVGRGRGRPRGAAGGSATSCRRTSGPPGAAAGGWRARPGLSRRPPPSPCGGGPSRLQRAGRRGTRP